MSRVNEIDYYMVPLKIAHICELIFFHRQHRIISRKRKAITNSKKNRKVYPDLLAKANFIEPSENFRKATKEI